MLVWVFRMLVVLFSEGLMINVVVDLFMILIFECGVLFRVSDEVFVLMRWLFSELLIFGMMMGCRLKVLIYFLIVLILFGVSIVEVSILICFGCLLVVWFFGISVVISDLMVSV